MREQKRDRAADEQPIHAPASTAIRYFLGHLSDAARMSGYSPPKNVKIGDVLGDHGVIGHSIVLPAPKNGFTREQKELMDSYAKTLTYWRKLLVELDWQPQAVTVSFTQLGDEESDEQIETKPKFRERLKGAAYLAIRGMAQVLVNQGFLVREPISVTILTNDIRPAGYAIMLKYPGSRKRDQAGVIQAYDEWVPLLADVFARASNLRSETINDGIATTVFFTKDQRYVPSRFDPHKSLRILVPRQKKRSNALFFRKPTYRACRTITQRYKKDFDITKKPLPSWGVNGHSIIMNYKKGAAGRIVDETYLHNVRLMSERLMKKFHVQASILQHTDSRTLVITFFSGARDQWLATGDFVQSVTTSGERVTTV